MWNVSKAQVAAAFFMCGPLFSATEASAQANIVTSAQGCSVLAADNVGACCAEQNREAVERFLSVEGRKICSLAPDERTQFLAEQAASAAARAPLAGGAAAVAAGTPMTGAAAAPAARPDSNPGNEKIGKDGLEVGRASETPGNASPGEMGGGSHGRSDTPDSGTATASAGSAASGSPNSAGGNGNGNGNGGGKP
jgi:hypothetical protein